MAIDPKLLVIKPINEIQTASDPLSGQALIYDGGNELKKASLQGIKDSVSSGIKGEATPSTVPTPWTSGQPDLYEKYDVQVAGTFTNFKDSGNNPLVITTDDLSNNFVQIWIKNGVAKKKIVNAIPPPPVIGVVVEGNTQAVSGGKVYNAINDIMLMNEQYGVLSTTLNSDGVISSANIQWEDGVTGTLTFGDYNSDWLAYDSYTITYQYKIVTQPKVTRDSNGTIIISHLKTIS